MQQRLQSSLAAIIGTLAALAAGAAPVTYRLDPKHTYPSFEADHMGGLSVWRGKFTETSGTVVYDKEAKSGSIDVTVNTASVQFGLDKMDEEARKPSLLDAEKYPTATYSGKFSKFDGATPIEAQGTFTLHGVSHPLVLKIDSFKCQTVVMLKKEVCGADASAVFDRSTYGITAGDKYGFKMSVKLQIQVEGSPET